MNLWPQAPQLCRKLPAKWMPAGDPSFHAALDAPRPDRVMPPASRAGVQVSPMGTHGGQQHANIFAMGPLHATWQESMKRKLRYAHSPTQRHQHYPNQKGHSPHRSSRRCSRACAAKCLAMSERSHGAKGKDSDSQHSQQMATMMMGCCAHWSRWTLIYDGGMKIDGRTTTGRQ